MTVIYEGQGHWWLPGREDKKVPGTITFDSEKGGNLSLIGALSHWTEYAEVVPTEGGGVMMEHTAEVEERSGSYPRIYGEVDGKAVTLEDAFQTHSKGNLFGRGSEERIFVNRLFTELWWGEGETAEVTALVVNMAYLNDWAIEKYIGETHVFHDDEPGRLKRWELSIERRPARATNLDDGLTLTLQHHIGIGGRRSTERHLSQGYSLRLDFPTLTPVDDAVDVASDFQDLVSIATGRNAEYQQIYGYHPDLKRTLDPDDDTKDRPFPFELFATWNIRDRADKPDEIQNHELFFRFDDLGGMDGITKWMRAAKQYRSTLGRTMAIRAREGMFMSDRLLNYTAALEGFDRQKTGVTTNDLPARLRRCIDLAGEPFRALVGHVTWWVEAVTWHRNDIAHHLGREPRGPAVQQHYLAESLYWLAVYVMLREADAPQEVYDRIGAHQHFHYLGPKIKAAVTAYGQAAGQPSPAASPAPALEAASTPSTAADADATPDPETAPDVAEEAMPDDVAG